MADVQHRFGAGLGKLLYLGLLLGPQVEVGVQAAPIITGTVTVAVLVVAGTYLGGKLLAFRRWSDELAHVPKFLRAMALLLTVIVVENFCTYVVSATDAGKHGYTPLQDNVALAMDAAFEAAPPLRAVVLGWGVDMHWLLYAFVGLCLSVLWDQVPYSGFGMAARFMDTVAWAHAIRTVAFMVTVLPNPKPNCYARSFAPPPSDPWEFVRVGFSGKRGSGCNDLVISGHCVVYAAVALAWTAFYPRRGGGRRRARFSNLLWLAVVKLCLQETVQRTHYSVDMLLAVVVTALVWAWRAPLYPAPAAAWPERKPGAPADPVPKTLLGLVFGSLVLVFVGVKGV